MSPLPVDDSDVLKGADVAIDGPTWATLGTPGCGEGISVRNDVPRHISYPTFVRSPRPPSLDPSSTASGRSPTFERIDVAERARVRKVEFDHIVVVRVMWRYDMGHSDKSL